MIRARQSLLLGIFLSIALLAAFFGKNFPGGNDPGFPAAQAACERLGWFPAQFGLKDHGVFTFQDTYYLVSIHLPGEKKFAYARSTDLCTWEMLPWLLADRQPGTWDEMAVWAPFVYEEGGTYFMYYTGVTLNFTQSIMLMTTTNPADASAWEKYGVVFQPDHPGMVWEPGTWADNRDATVIKVEDTYYLYYAGTDESGGIVGLATAITPYGPWEDWGPILTLDFPAHPESPTLYPQGGLYYLVYNNTAVGEEYRVGASPGGPWEEPKRFAPGWAHELWMGLDGRTYTSYLTDYNITISPLTWDTFFTPASPFIGEEVFHQVLPLVLKPDES